MPGKPVREKCSVIRNPPQYGKCCFIPGVLGAGSALRSPKSTFFAIDNWLALGGNVKSVATQHCSGSIVCDEHDEQQEEPAVWLAGKIQRMLSAHLTRTSNDREELTVQVPRIFCSKEEMLSGVRGPAKRVAIAGEHGSNHLVVSQPRLIDEPQVWFLAAHVKRIARNAGIDYLRSRAGQVALRNISLHAVHQRRATASYPDPKIESL